MDASRYFIALIFIYRDLMMDLEEIEQRVRPLKLTRRWRELSAYIYCLLHGVKPGFLWDLGPVTTIHILRLEVVVEDIVVLQLGNSDYFVTRRHLFINHHFNNYEPMFVDLSREQPTCLRQSEVNETKIMLNMSRQVVKCNDSILQNEVDEDGKVNLTTLFGLLLGYPVVYTFSDSDDVTSLNNIELNIYKVFLKNIEVISFSVPSVLVNNVSQHIDSWKDRLDKVLGSLSIDHSFSVDHVNLPCVTL